MADGFDIVSYLMGKQAGGEPPGPTPGGYGYTKLAEQDFTVNTTSTTETSVGTLTAPGAYAAVKVNKSKLLYVRVSNKGEKQAGYFWGADCFLGSSRIMFGYRINSQTGAISIYEGSSGFGIYPSTNITEEDVVTIAARYNSNASSAYSCTINGTFHVEVYLLDWPDGVSPFN